jgi:tetratricopeptide (TPR) repeat protein
VASYLKIDPDSSFRLNDRGGCHLKAGRPEEAVTDFTAAIKLDPYPTFYRSRAAAYRKMGEFQKAAEDEARAYEMDNS